MGALLFVTAAADVLTHVMDTLVRGLGHHGATKKLVVAAVEHADTVLIAAALVIIGIGLYTLFVGEVARLPKWLEIANLYDLKDKLVSVVVVVLAVNFFTHAVAWVGDPNIIYLGAGTGLVIASLAAYGALHLGKKTDSGSE